MQCFWRVLGGAALAQLCCAALALGQTPAAGDVIPANLSSARGVPAYYWDIGYQPAPGPAGAPMMPAPAAAPSSYPAASVYAAAPAASSQTCSISGLDAGSCDGVTHGLVAFTGYDSWKGVPDGGWQNNGIHTGLNFGTRLGQFSEWTGIGFQIGGSVGVYDWGGSGYRLVNENQAETQGFFTYGLFRNATPDSRWSAALVQDWMFNSNFGVFAENPTLSQLRGQVAYAITDWDEFGLWGACRTSSATRDVNGFGPTTWRALDQLNVFWHHKWAAGGADSSIWLGVPEQDRLAGGGSIGDWQVGIAGNFPLNDWAAVYTLITYVHATAAPGPAAFDDEVWSFSIGLALYPSRNARSCTVMGQRWMPKLSVANNGTFPVDTSRSY